MRQYRLFLNFDREEQWLNGMARQGYRLEGKSFGYRFRRAAPEDANIRIDYRRFRRQSDFEDYRAIFEDSGWEHLAGTKGSGHQYFRQKEEGPADDIFSDADSKAARYLRLSRVWLSLACAFLPIFVALIVNGEIDAAAFLHPRNLYYTPGLWERSGGSFWRGFLFETPFALLRGLVWLAIPLLVVLYGVFGARARWQYEAHAGANPPLGKG